MEENTMAAVTETVPQGPDHTAAAPAAGSPSPAEDAPEGTAVDPGTATPREDLIAYRFNHETKTVSRKEAPGMIQRLLKARQEAEKAQPLLDKLRFLAEAGDKTPENYLSSLEEDFNKAEYARFLQSAGGNEEIAGKLAEMARNERQQRFKTTAVLREEQERDRRQDTTRRMGAELADLQREFPEIKEFKDLPESVVKEALEGGISLMDGYLRFLYRSTKAAEEQKARQQKAAAASSGSMRGEPEHKEKADEQISAFIAAFRN